MNIKQTVKKKIKELGDKAPEYFGKKQSTINTWLKTGNYPVAAIEKVLNDQPTGEATAPTVAVEPDRGPPQAERQPSSAVMPHRPDPANPPKEIPQPEPKQETAQPVATITIEQRVDANEKNIQITAKYINEEINVKIETAQEQITALGTRVSQLEQFIRERTQPTAPTVAQALNGELLQTAPSGVRPAAGPNVVNYSTHAAPLAQPASRHFLDTGIAPSKEEVEAQQVHQAVNLPPGQTANRLAGPALQEPMPLNPQQ